MNDYIQSLFGLLGKVAIVTGSSKGIGKAIAESYATLGASVVVSSRKADACEAVAESIRLDGGEAISIPCNISNEDDLARLVDRTLKKWGRIDTLVCNAAINPYFGPLVDVDEKLYHKTMDTNILSNLQLSKRVQPGMASRRDGSIIFISSIAGVRGSANLGVYSLTKAADMQLARNLAVEFGPDNIRVNCIAPGLIRTDFSRKRWENDEQLGEFLKTYPIGRIGEPEDMIGVAVLLAGKAGGFITGQTYFVDGGVTIGGG
ncbi:MAG: NAD(P)-dependent dehydrogenase (short-subunit alcohol dehydrogenase family) [Parasphingorhabdus sp.]|jgi:NAD(P)-dependent dehydrogenase (short-subunit alcohol dehydrogenase family)